MVDVVLYVEGGGDGRLLHDQCRKGFRLFLEGAGLKGRMPRIVACGGREQAYDRFCMKVEEAEKHKNCIPILLIDSECAIDPKYETGDHEDWKPWDFLTDNEGKKWNCPSGAKNSQCHFMVQCMESWLLCDIENLKTFFGQGFSEKNLPKAGTNVESIDKQKVYNCIKDATQRSEKKGCYNKGSHSFVLLGTTDYKKVISKSKWADRFIKDLKDLLMYE